MKVFNWIFVVLFVLFAAVQYNDPDPYLWMPIYLYAAALCWLASRYRFPRIAYWVGFAAYLPYAVYKAFDQNGLVDWIRYHNAENIAGTMKAETPWVEETREFFGLVIVIAVLALDYFWLRRRKAKAEPVAFRR